MSKKRHKNFSINYTPIFLPVLIAIIGLFGMWFVKQTGIFSPGSTTIVTSSTLMDAINISELSTAKYTYNGIAKVYKDDSDTVECNIYYHSTVKAGVDFSKVEFDVDKGNKIVTAKLPEIEITANILDEEGMEFLPENSDISLKKARRICKQDAEDEATQSTALHDTAEENLKNTIEALTHPLLEKNGYTIEWSD